MKNTSGYTIVELIIVLGVIGILAVITFGVPTSLYVRNRDVERRDDVDSIARRLEIGYTVRIGDIGPYYPKADDYISSIQSGSGTPYYPGDDALRGPNVFAPAISLTVPSNPAAASSPSPSKDQYIYVPYTDNGQFCSTSNAPTKNCVRFTIFFRTEQDNAIQRKESIRQQ